MSEPCQICGKDLSTDKTITAIEGRLLHNSCARDAYSLEDLRDLGEEVVPSDIGIK